MACEGCDWRGYLGWGVRLKTEVSYVLWWSVQSIMKNEMLIKKLGANEDWPCVLKGLLNMRGQTLHLECPFCKLYLCLNAPSPKITLKWWLSGIPWLIQWLGLPGFDPWSRNLDSTRCRVRPEKKRMVIWEGVYIGVNTIAWQSVWEIRRAMWSIW